MPRGSGSFAPIGEGPVAGVRYLEVLALPEGGHRLYYEAPLPDGSHELRTEVVRVAPSEQTSTMAP